MRTLLRKVKSSRKRQKHTGGMSKSRTFDKQDKELVLPKARTRRNEGKNLKNNFS